MKLWLALAVVALLVPVAGAQAKPGPDLPTWLGAAEKQLLTSLGNPRTVAIFHITYPRKVAVVLEFQQVVVCRMCPSSPGHPLRARVIRISFDRRTHAVGDEMRLCEVQGARPPLARCLAR
jgi:hypothetical protein